MKIFNKKQMYDSNPSLKCIRLESGAILIYAGDKDKTIGSIWKRSVTT